MGIAEMTERARGYTSWWEESEPEGDGMCYLVVNLNPHQSARFEGRLMVGSALPGERTISLATLNQFNEIALVDNWEGVVLPDLIGRGLTLDPTSILWAIGRALKLPEEVLP